LDGVVDGSVGIAVEMISLDNLFMFDGGNGVLCVDKKDEYGKEDKLLDKICHLNMFVLYFSGNVV
jgi:hypothetical protein